MRILLNFDEELLREYEERGSPSFFGIAWEERGSYYPSKDWTDFGADILSWWIGSAIRLAESADEEKFQFEDGPYAIRARYDRRTNSVDLRPEGTGIVWTVPFDELALELSGAANSVCEEFRRLRIAEQNCISLERGVTILRSKVQPNLDG